MRKGILWATFAIGMLSSFAIFDLPRFFSSADAQITTPYLQRQNNLSDLLSKPAALTNLGAAPAFTVGTGLALSGGVLSATGSSGTVTSVALAMPAIFTVSGSPVTSSGTLTAALATQSPNLFLAGPSSGAAAAPTFRALVAADLPNPSFTASGTTSLISGTPTTFYTMPSGLHACLVNISLNVNDAGNYAAGAMVVTDNSTAAVVMGGASPLMTISTSGLAVQAKQTAATLTGYWSVFCIK